MAAPFVPLRIHSAYSFRESLVRLERLYARAVEMEIPAFALVDRDTLFGAVPVTQLAQSGGPRPILGSLLTLADGSSLTLLVENEQGYANLCRLLSHRHLEAPPDRATVAAHADGLMALSGGVEGAVARALAQGDHAGALEAADWLREAFGERAYLEVEKPGAQANLARRAGLSRVAASPVRYLNATDAGLWRITQRGHRRAHDEQGAYHLPPPAEWAQCWEDDPEPSQRCLEIADRCRFALPLGRIHLPRFPGVDDPAARLAALCEAAMPGRYGPAPAPAVRARLAHELGVINAMGFADYFLIQDELASWCRAQGIALGPGRGSAAGSLVSYLLGLADVEPLSMNLSFERFLNEGRQELPDVDLDLCWLRRDEAIAHLYERYGTERTARLATITTLGPRGAIRLAGAGLGMEPERVDRLAKAAGYRGLARELTTSPTLQAVPWQEEPYRSLLTVALAVEGLPDHVGTHPCGVVVTPGPIQDLVPLQQGPDGGAIAMADKNHAEALGLLKMDLLGNRNLTILADAVARVNAETGLELDAGSLPLDDAEAFALLGSGKTLGIYQLESTGVQSLLRQYGPKNLEDMTAITSLYRPGPIEGGIKDAYVARRFGTEPVTYPHPCLEPVLRHTFGTVLFQEQVLEVGQVFAGLTAAEADGLRRAVSKLKRDEMARVGARFVEGARALGRSEHSIREVFDLVSKFAGYGFVKAHAAASQVVAIRQAYVKARWPIHYQAAVLSTGMGYYQPRVYIEDALRFGATLAGPCVQRSEVGYTAEPGGVLRVGLGFVAEVGAGAERLVAARRERPYSSFTDLRARAGLPKDALLSLVHSGACDGFGVPRAGLVWSLAEEATPKGAGGLLPGLALPTDAADAWPFADYDEATKTEQERAATGLCWRSQRFPAMDGALPFRSLACRSPGNRVRVVAEVVHTRRARTKDGKAFVLFMILSDGWAHLPAVLFPEAYRRDHAQLREDGPLVFAGRIEFEGQEPLLQIEAISRFRFG